MTKRYMDALDSSKSYTYPFNTLSAKKVVLFLKYKILFSSATVRVIFKFVEMVENRSEGHIKDTVDAIIFDEWNSNTTHYIGVCFSFIR